MRRSEPPPSLTRTAFDRMEFASTVVSQQALEEFRWQRNAALVCGALGVVSVARATGPSGKLLFTLGLSLWALAIAIELGARSLLLHILASEALQFGVSESTARFQAKAFLGRILREHARRLERRRALGLPDIVITMLDRQRIQALLAGGTARVDNRLANNVQLDSEEREALEEELARAEIVSSYKVPPDVVTMNSRVCFADESGTTREVTLVYPQDTDPTAADSVDRCISVFSPVGSALLGLRVGQAIDWTLPQGARKRFRILSVPYQPEAAGHFHL